MPIITVKLLEGRTKEQKAKAAKRIAQVASEELSAPLERITIMFEDMKKVDYAPQGELAEK